MGVVVQLRGAQRPMPPEPCAMFEPAHDLGRWLRATFIEEAGALHNPDHAHLADAEIGVLWTTVDNSSKQRTVLGQAELMPPMAFGKWQKSRAEYQLLEWFDGVPDFLITISAGYAATCDDASFCALVEHELYHCAQARDRYGAPRFGRDGSPMWALRGHDVEEFVGVVERYGARAAGVTSLVEAARRGPLIGQASIAQACGTCLKRAG